MGNASDAGKLEPRFPSLGASSSGADKKQHPPRETRLHCIPTKGLVYAAERAEPTPAEIRDVSKSGMRLVLGEPIAVGSAVTVEWVDMVVAGEIRYCRPNSGNSFDAGVEIGTAQNRERD